MKTRCTIALFSAALACSGAVQVDFSHSYTGNPAVTQNTRDVTLSFTVDGSGNVTLDASCADPDPAAYVDEWDGAVGSLTNPALWGTSFTLGVLGVGNLRIDNGGNGLSIQGGNAQRIDWAGEAVTVTATLPVGTLKLQSVNYANATLSAGTLLDVDSTSYALTGAGGSVDVSAQSVSDTFSISSASDTDGQGFVLSGFAFDIAVTPPAPGSTFDNGSGDGRWGTGLNWDPDGLPVAPSNAVIDGFDVVVDGVIAASPSALQLRNGSLTVTTNGNLLVESMEIGTDLAFAVSLVMDGSSAQFGYAGVSPSNRFVVGSAATIETRPHGGGSSPLELGAAELSLELGSQWILDGAGYTGTFNLGDRFVLAHYGSLSGDTAGVRFRNVNLPADRDLRLIETSTSLVYEVVAQTSASGPNIIVVNVDDMVAGQHFNFEGRDSLTPTLDSLAAGGIHFTRAFAASTVCGPSRYAMLTGRWASRNTSANFAATYPLNTLGRFGVSDTELEPDGENIGAWLQRAGYRTGFVGKAHVLDDDLVNTGAWAAKGLVTYSPTIDPATDAQVNGAMRHNHRVLCQRMRAYGFDYVGGFYRANLKELASDSLNFHNQEWITSNALDFIDENHHQRFFLYMAPTINHGPVRNDLSRSLLADPRYTSAGYLPNEDYSFMPTRSSIVDEVHAGNKQLISARETWIDYSIAAITNKLAAHGIENDTLILFTADHGEKTLNQTPVIWGKSSLYDLGMRVPFVMHWPGGIANPGRTYDESVIHIDLVPTFLELAGAAPLPTRVVDGQSLVPVLNGSSAALRDDVFCEIGYARGVRTRDWKYIAVRYTPSVYAQIDSGYLWRNFNTGLFTEPRPYYVNNSSLGYLARSTHPGYFDDDQLYDLANDPLEQTNLYGQYPQIAYNLKKRLGDYMGDIPNRPFRQFSNASKEFSPAPAGAPAAPADVQMQFLGVDSVQLDWGDLADSELGFIVEQSTNGAPFEIVAERPSGGTTATVAVDTGVEDVLLRVSSYNALGDSAAASEVDLLAPDNWRYRTFGSTTSSNSQWIADPDGDGLKTLWEYAFATNPLDSNSTDRIHGEILDAGTNIWLQINVPRDARRNVEMEGRVSTNLTDWAIGPPASVTVEDSEQQLILRSATPFEQAPRQFMGAEVTVP